MTFRLTRGAGWPARPRALGALLMVGFGIGALVAPRARREDRGPARTPNPASRTVLDSAARGIRWVVAPGAPELLHPDSIPPSGAAQLLWLEGRPAHPTAAGGAVVLDGAGGAIHFGSDLRAARPRMPGGGAEILSLAPAAEGGWWLTDTRGYLVRLDDGGRTMWERLTEFSFPAVASEPADGRAWLVRAPDHFAYDIPAAGAPLLARVAADGALTPVGAAIVPDHILLADLASAGRLAIGNGVVYFAPFIRDEVIAMTAAGDTIWVLSRGLSQTTPEPRFEVVDGRAVINYHPVNLGLVLGPGGRLWVLSTPEFTMVESRLDEVDPATGRLVASVRLPTAQPTLAADADGRVYALDPARLLSGVPERHREPLPAFDLPRPDGTRLTSGALAGRVTVVNFWASWCAPCRTEMPLLDSLNRSLPHPEFQLLGLSDDRDAVDAVDFAARLDLGFPILLGGGHLVDAYRLPGLPVTYLVDRQGRVAGRWIGELGHSQIADIRALAVRELGAGSGPGPAHHAHEGH